MQMVKKSALIVVAVWFAIIIFMPKSEIYYTVEKQLNKKDITLNEKSIEEGLFMLSLHDVTVYVKGIALANIERVDFFTLLFYSSLELEGLRVDEVLHAKVPRLTKEATFRHSLFSPTTISIDANGSFGVVEGAFNLMDNQLHINFVETNEISMIQAQLQKGEKGWFYESSF